MSDPEYTRQTPRAMVVSSYPDVCRSPTAPVPYQIVSIYQNARNVTKSVKATNQCTFTEASYIQGVEGDEGGTGEGVKSGTHAGGGRTEPINYCPTVRAEGQRVVRHDDPHEMNNRNTKGKAVFDEGSQPRNGVGPDGKPTQDANPPVKPETPAEAAGTPAAPAGQSPSPPDTMPTYTPMGDVAAPAAAPPAAPAAPEAPGGVPFADTQPTYTPMGDVAAPPVAPQGENPSFYPRSDESWWDYGNRMYRGYQDFMEAHPRISGAVDLFGAGGQGALAVGLASSPTGVGQVAGYGLGVNALDRGWTAARQIWTGENQRTLLSQGVERGAGLFTNDPELAERIGEGTQSAINTVSGRGPWVNRGLRNAKKQGTQIIKRKAGEAGEAVRDALKPPKPPLQPGSRGPYPDTH